MASNEQLSADHVTEADELLEDQTIERVQNGYVSEHSDNTDAASTAESEESESEWETESSDDQHQEQEADDEEDYFESRLVPGSRLEAETMMELEKSYPSLQARKGGKRKQQESTHQAYIVSKDVIDGIFAHTQHALRHTDKEHLTRALLTANHNVRPLAQAYDKQTISQTTKADREADKTIKDAFASGKPLSEHATMRACQQFSLLCEVSESIPHDVFNVMIACYGKLKDQKGQPAVPKATRAILTKVRTAKPHHVAKQHPHTHVPTHVPAKTHHAPATTASTTTADASCSTEHRRPLRPHRLHHIVI